MRRDPTIDRWMAAQAPDLSSIAMHWFSIMRDCGEDVCELLHDGHPTACVGDAAFAYVNAFTNHVNVGFFPGAVIDDPYELLQGTGKYMRHVKLAPNRIEDSASLHQLIMHTYRFIKLQANK